MKFSLENLITGLIIALAPGFAQTLVVAPNVSAPSRVEQRMETIDTLDYFISDHLDQGLGGSHNKSQVVTGNVSYYTKWSSEAYEIHTWDDEYIYLNEDHSWKAEEGYAFQPGKWLKRYMQIGEQIDQSGNQGFYFATSDCALQRVEPQKYVMTLERHDSTYDIGGDLGVQDVIVVKYDYSKPGHPDNFERFYYSREWGWIKWELYEQSQLVKESVFNQIHDQPVQPDRNISCTQGGSITPGSAAAVAPQTEYLKIRTGQAVKVSGAPAIYYINSAAYREYVCHPQVLVAYDIAPQAIAEVSWAELNSYPPLTYVRFPDSDRVYMVEGESLRPITMGVAQRLGLSLDTIPLVDPVNFSCYRSGPPVE
jgi:hypothetical protein